MTPNSIDILRELTFNLPSIPKLGDLITALGSDPKSSSYEVNLPQGYFKTYALFSSSEVSVARSFMSLGTEFPEHIHIEKEYLLIYSGSVLVRSEGKEEILKSGDVIVYNPNVPHYALALDDTWFIAITVPFSKDYPQHE